ncbi:LAMI_0E04500g1_1 [Lachancea mirantina]|uniref:Conserved oligomeric Golgi complex subunit 5 n=1 Tax=Lachancea mirantina TaxID=1230905 RepID=A0A1G4JKE8_9SACH|nr:LAMI_0E04500g1_1 [Lachancea mirantina]
MTADQAADGFEFILEDDYSGVRYCSELLKKDSNPDGLSIDLETPIKKLQYDIDEMDNRVEAIIKQNSIHVIEQIETQKEAHSFAQKSMEPTLDYLNLSYRRLETDIIQPYEHALRLQSALSKIHQTSNGLREVLVFLYLTKQVSNVRSLNEKDPDFVKQLLAMASAHEQIQKTFSENVGLKSLRVVKKYEIEVVKPSRQHVLKSIAVRFGSLCLDQEYLQNNSDNLAQLALSLYALSPKECFSCLDKSISMKISRDSQLLTKTITSIRNFSNALDEVVMKCKVLGQLESSLTNYNRGSQNLLLEYISHKKTESLVRLYWSRIARNFKTEFEVSLKRGGPVGKSLITNSKAIIQSINKFMKLSSDDDSWKKNLELMLDAVSSLNSI